jgi:hypothetical protein
MNPVRTLVATLVLIVASSTTADESYRYDSDMVMFVGEHGGEIVTVVFDFSRCGIPLGFVHCEYFGLLGRGEEWETVLAQTWRSLGEPEDIPRSTSIHARWVQGSRFVVSLLGRTHRISVTTDTLRPMLKGKLSTIAATGKGDRRMTTALARATMELDGVSYYGAVMYERLTFPVRERHELDTTYTFWEHGNGHSVVLFWDDHKDMYHVYPREGTGKLRMYVKGYYGWDETYDDVASSSGCAFVADKGRMHIEVSDVSEWSSEGHELFSAVGSPCVTYTTVRGMVRLEDERERAIIGVVRRVEGRPVGFVPPVERPRPAPPPPPPPPPDTTRPGTVHPPIPNLEP